MIQIFRFHTRCGVLLSLVSSEERDGPWCAELARGHIHPGGGGAPLLRERAAGRGMVLVLDALNRVCYFT